MGSDSVGTLGDTSRDVAADSPGSDSAGMAPCSTLKALADRPLLGSWRTHYAYYSPDRSWLLLQVRGDRDSLIRVELSSGAATTIVDSLNAAWPLGNSGRFLLMGTGSGGDEMSVYDGKEVRKLVGKGSCNFAPTPDGTRFYAVGSCVGDENGLAVIDMATGKMSIVDKSATMATTWGMVVSPNSQWVAYRTGESNRTARTITLASATGSPYTLTSTQVVDSIEFASDELLVFQTTDTAGIDGDLRGHVPGSGDTSFLIVPDHYGYQFSLDRSRVLVAKMNRPLDSRRLGSLSSVPSHGGDPLLLVKDWSIPYPDMGYPFSFDAQGKYALFVSEVGLDPVAYTVSVVDMKGSAPRKLSNGAGFGLTPATSSVLLFDTNDDGRYRLRLTDLATGVDRFTYSSNEQIIDATAVRNDQAVLFVETDGDSRRARFMSASYPQSVALGEWNDPDYRGSSTMPVQPDPTGCFTVVNTELPPGPGTRLVLLPE